MRTFFSLLCSGLMLVALNGPLVAAPKAPAAPAKPAAAPAKPAAKPTATPAATPAFVPGASGYVENGDFGKSRPFDNLWDGVNAGGGLAGEVRGAYAITE